MAKQYSYIPGKINYNNHAKGYKTCKVEIEWSLTDDNVFSMSGTIWNHRETDCYCAGQILETIVVFFPHDRKVQRMVEIWREYHLNDMQAGSPKQMKILKQKADNHMDYLDAVTFLTLADMNPDLSYIHNGEPYSYGSAWLKKEIPQDIINEIKSWSE
jgi:hypothetical protein